MTLKINNDEGLITRKQLAKRWSCSDRTVDRAVKEGIIPVVDIGGGKGQRQTVRFSLVDVRLAEEKNKRTTTQEIPHE